MVVRRAICLALLLFLQACQSQDALEADVLITGGRVFTGEAGSTVVEMDVAVRDGKIVFVGDASELNIQAVETISLQGEIVSPGFIDPHTHSLNDLLSSERNENQNYLAQGVTTVFNGNDGGGPTDIAETRASLEQNGIGNNTALFIGHGSLRDLFMAGEDRPPTASELNVMQELIRTAMVEGALGFSTGLYYAPGSFGDTDEVVALASAAADLGGIYESHLRDESSYTIGLIGAVKEAIEIGRRANIPVHIAHIKALGVDVWGQSADVIELVQKARSAGIRVTADQYPWQASGTQLRNTLVPRWVLEGSGDEYMDRLADPGIIAEIRSQMVQNLRRRGGPESLLIVMANDDEVVGKTLGQVAAERQLDPIDAAVELMLDGATRVASFNMNSEDIEAFMSQSWVMTSSDGTDGHPRKYASFPRKYQHYVVEKDLLTLEEFLFRSSALTADTFGLDDRGRIAVGKAADIVVFDPEAFAPLADFSSWNRLSTGVSYLLVNGEFAIRNGDFTGALAGKVLAPSVDSTS